LVNAYQLSEETAVSEFIPKMEAVSYAEKLVSIYQNTRRHSQEDCNL
jgi:hypothetical protein